MRGRSLFLISTKARHLQKLYCKQARNNDETLKALFTEFGEDLNEVKDSIKLEEKQLIEEIEMNQLDQKEAGHHGVPLNVYQGKYYFGQDNPFDDLIDKLIKDGVIKSF